jgi:hypothetical protein
LISRKLSWSDSLDVSVHAEAKLFGVFKTGVDVGYRHEVAAEYEISQEYETPVEYKHTVAFYIQPSYLELTGDFTLTNAVDIKLIKNFTVRLPLGTEYSPPGHPELKYEPAVVHSVDLGESKSCRPRGGQKLRPGSPPPPGAQNLGPAKTV